MATRRRWLQFSLRGFIVVLTISCLWLGWKVERIRRRGRTIDAMVTAGNTVLYIDAPDENIHPNRQIAHFSPDLRGSRVRIFLAARLNAAIAFQLSEIYGIGRLDLVREHSDDELQYLDGLTDGCQITFHDVKGLTVRGLERLQQRFPHSTIECPFFGRWIALSEFLELQDQIQPPLLKN